MAEPELEENQHGLLIVRLSDSPEDMAAKVGRNLIRTFREPENLAAISGGLVLPLVVFRGRRVPFLPFLVISLIGSAGGRLAWQAARDLRAIARAAEANPMFPGKPDQ